MRRHQRQIDELQRRSRARAEELRARGARYRNRDPGILQPLRRMLRVGRLAAGVDDPGGPV